MSNEKSRNTPKVRFQGFNKDWKKHKLAEIVDLKSGRDYKHLQAGTVPVYGTGGYMLSVNEALSTNEDAVGIGRKGTIDRPYILKAPFWTVDTLFFAIPKPMQDLQFVYGLFEGINWKQFDESTGVPSLSKSTINKVSVFKPQSVEQAQIGKILSILDDTITLHQRKHVLLLNLKQSYLQKLFPKNGSRLPELRFQGFNNDWKQREAKNLCDISTGKSNTQDKVDGGKYPFYVRSATVERSTKYLFDEEAVLTVGDGVGTGKVYHYVTGKYDLHQRVYRMYSFSQQIKGKFFYYYFSTHFYRRVQAMTAKTSVDSVRLEMISEMNIMFPDMQEQVQIVRFLDTVDRAITLHQRQLDNLKQLKKWALQNLFV